MALRVEHVEGEYRVVLSAEALEALGLRDGAEVEVKPVDQSGVSAEVSGSRYATVEEVIEAYLKTEPLHRNTYRELAK